MTWFSASLVVVVEQRENKSSFTVLENVLLVEGTSLSEAKEKASKLGAAEEYDDPTLMLDGKPAITKFVGIRKLVQVFDSDASDPDTAFPREGVEVSFSRFDLKSRDDLEAFVKGQEVNVVYLP